jgi:elongation factor 1-gamma
LTTHTFLVGERITLADLTLAATLSAGLGYLLDAEWRKAHPAVLRLYETVVNQPSLKSAYGETQYIDKAVQYTPPPKEAKEAKAPAPAAAPKEAKPKPKKEAEPEDDDDDGIPRDEPKAKNPLDSLPKSDFNLEDWKRTYSNLDTRGAGGSVEWLYSK